MNDAGIPLTGPALLAAAAAPFANDIMNHSQGLFDGTGHGYRPDAGLGQLLSRQVADHGRRHRPTTVQGLDDGIELAMAKRVVRLEGTILLVLSYLS